MKTNKTQAQIGKEIISEISKPQASVNYGPTENAGEVQVNIIVQNFDRLFIATAPLVWDAVNRDWRASVRFQNGDTARKVEVLKQVSEIAKECADAKIPMLNSLEKAIEAAKARGMM